ncbi:MAG: YlxR family protein [Pseudolysinimonas sp.]
MEPVRTCLGCRQRVSRSSLVRVVARDGRVVVDSTVRLPGRGAWMHPDAGCIENAIRRSAFGRALRTTISDMTDLNEWAEKTMDN